MKYLLTSIMIIFGTPIFAQQLYPFPQDGKWGYINSTGKIIVQPIYEAGGFFSEGLARVAKLNDRGEYLYGFINTSGREVITPKFISVSEFKGGIARVKIRNQYNPLLTNGTLLSNSYDEIFPCTNGISRIKKNNLYGFIDSSGRQISSPQFSKAYNFRDGLALVTFNDNRKESYGFINETGSVVIPFQYKAAHSFSEGFAGVLINNNSWSFIDKQQNIITDKIFEEVGEFHEGLARVRINGHWGFINTAGEMIIPPIYKMADNFYKGLAIVGDGRFFAFINKSGKQITPYIFTRVTRFDGILARVSKGSSNGFMNSQGRYNLSDKIASIGSFYNQRARMRVGNYYGYYGSDAKLAIQPSFLYASDFKDVLAITVAPVNGGYRVAYINQVGKIVKAWNVTSNPIPKQDQILFNIIYPSIPFYKESDPASRIIIKANYGAFFTKTYQQRATPINGHGLNGLLYSADYFAKPGYIFSEAVSSFPVPKINMGIYPYFRDRFGIVSETSSPNEFKGTMNTTFFNGSTLTRVINRSIVSDSYFVPFMKVSEALFLLAAAVGNPLAEYPEERSTTLPNFLSKNSFPIRFNGRRDSNNNPIEFSLNFNKERIAVIDKGYGITILHNYPKPNDTIEYVESSTFFTSTKIEEIAEPIITNILLQQELTNTINSIDIITQMNSTNTIDLTSAIIEDVNQITTQQQQESIIIE